MPRTPRLKYHIPKINTHSWAALPSSTEPLYKCLAVATCHRLLTNTSLQTGFMRPCELDSTSRSIRKSHTDWNSVNWPHWDKAEVPVHDWPYLPAGQCVALRDVYGFVNFSVISLLWLGLFLSQNGQKCVSGSLYGWAFSIISFFLELSTKESGSDKSVGGCRCCRNLGTHTFWFSVFFSFPSSVPQVRVRRIPAFFANRIKTGVQFTKLIIWLWMTPEWLSKKCWCCTHPLG